MIFLIAFDLIDMTVAALLGVSILIVFGILDGNDLIPIVDTAVTVSPPAFLCTLGGCAMQIAMAYRRSVASKFWA